MDRCRSLVGAGVDGDPVADDRELCRPGLVAQAARGPGLERPARPAERHLPCAAMRADHAGGDEPVGHRPERREPPGIPAEPGEPGP